MNLQHQQITSCKEQLKKSMGIRKTTHLSSYWSSRRGPPAVVWAVGSGPSAAARGNSQRTLPPRARAAARPRAGTPRPRTGPSCYGSACSSSAESGSCTTSFLSLSLSFSFSQTSYCCRAAFFFFCFFLVSALVVSASKRMSCVWALGFLSVVLHRRFALSKRE